MPAFQIRIEGKIIKPTAEAFPMEVVVVDEEGLFCDTANIVFADPLGKIALPKLGVKISIALGYEKDISDFGEYFVDECEMSSDARLTVRCKSIDYKNTLRKLNTRSFPKGKETNITLEKIVEIIASDYGMTSVCDRYAKSLSFRKVHEKNETDMHFLTRLTQSRGCSLKIKENVICILAKGGETASGTKLPVSTFEVGKNVMSWRYAMQQSEDYKSVSAVWRSWKTSEDKTVTVGDGEPVYGIPYRFATEKDAKDAATAKIRVLKSGVETLDMELIGNAMIRAERLAKVVGCREGIDGEWIIKRAEHKVSRSGYTVSVQCERLPR